VGLHRNVLDTEVASLVFASVRMTTVVLFVQVLFLFFSSHFSVLFIVCCVIYLLFLFLPLMPMLLLLVNNRPLNVSTNNTDPTVTLQTNVTAFKVSIRSVQGMYFFLHPPTFPLFLFSEGFIITNRINFFFFSPQSMIKTIYW
jgi:hypothetical protein